MKKTTLSEAQIFSMLNEAESGTSIAEVCRKYKIAQSTFYKFKAKYAGMSVSEMKRLRELEKENARLKKMFADVSLERDIIKDVLEKKYPELLEDI
jgi:putative transposase